MSGAGNGPGGHEEWVWAVGCELLLSVPIAMALLLVCFSRWVGRPWGGGAAPVTMLPWDRHGVWHSLGRSARTVGEGGTDRPGV